MRSPSRRLLFLLIAVAAAIVPAAIAIGAVVGERGTLIVSPVGGSPSADGPSDNTLYNLDGSRSGSTTPITDPIVGTPRPADNVEFSQDNRKVKYVAYDSAATNLVAGQPGDGHHHVYLFERQPSGELTPDGQIRGKLTRVDPNDSGDSIKPSLDGQTVTGNGAVTPHCVAFQSTSTLTKDDTSPKWSVYLFDTDGGSMKLISPPGVDARDGVVDGKCEHVTYESGGQVFVYWLEQDKAFALARGFNPDQQTDGKGAAYDRDGQVFYRSFVKTSLQKSSGKHFDALVPGAELLVSNSAADLQKGGNGPSSMASVNDNGAYIAFESKATDLCAPPQRCQGVGTDRNGEKSDVYRRTMTANAPTGSDNKLRIKAKTPKKVKKGKAKVIKYVKTSFIVGEEMEMISYDGTIDFQSDLDSDQVKISGAGEQACFRSFGVETHEKKFGPDAHTGNFMHVYFWNFPRERKVGKFTGESKQGRTDELIHTDKTQSFNWSCGISNRGNFIGFTSDTEGMSGETNGRQIPDMFVRFMGGSDEGL